MRGKTNRELGTIERKNTMNEEQDQIRQAAAALGRMGGKAGRGDKKRRSVEHYRTIGRKSGESRRLKRDSKTTA